MSGPRVAVLGLLWAGLSVARSLGRAGADVSGIVIHEHEFGLRSRYLTRRAEILDADERRRDERVLELLRRLAAAGPLFIVPERDDHVELVLRNWDEVTALGTVPLPSDPDVVHRLRRKELVLAEAERAGVPAPQTIAPAREEDIRAAGLVPPLVVKPVEGQHFAVAYGRKVLPAATVGEAVEAWRWAGERGFDMVVQEHVPDSHEKIFSLFTYIDRSGVARASVVGRKIRQGPLRFGTSAAFETRDEPRVLESGLRLLESVGYRGFGHVEFAHDARDDSFKLLEVNTRVPMWGGIAMTELFDVARLAYDDAAGRPLPPPRTFTDELVWIFFGKDVWVSAQMALRRELGPLGFLAPYARRPKVRAVFALDDPLPAAAAVRYLAAKVV